MDFIREPQGPPTSSPDRGVPHLFLLPPLPSAPSQSIRSLACSLCQVARSLLSSGKSTSRSDFPALSVWCGIHPCWSVGTLDGGHLALFPSLPQPFLSYAARAIKDNQVHPQSISQVDKLKLVAKIVDLTSNEKGRLLSEVVVFF